MEQASLFSKAAVTSIDIRKLQLNVYEQSIYA
jgi:hypothetical protein